MAEGHAVTWPGHVPLQVARGGARGGRRGRMLTQPRLLHGKAEPERLQSFFSTTALSTRPLRRL